MNNSVTIWTWEKPYIRTGDHKVEQIKGAHFNLTIEKNDGLVCINVFDDPGTDNDLCIVELPAEVLRLALSVLESNLGEK